MARSNRLLAFAGAAVAAGAGIAAQRTVINKRRRNDPELGATFGDLRGERSWTLDLDDGAHIFVEETGPESTRGALFVHGSVLTTDVWHYQMRDLQDHRLVFSDLRGHGRSTPKGSADYSVKTLANDLLAVIEEAGLDEVVVVGHSVGGMIALQLCNDRPDLVGTRIKGLGLINTTYGPVTETLIGSGAIARLERVTRRPLDFIGKQHERIEKVRRFVRPSDAIYWGVALAAFGENASPKQIDFTYDMLANTPVDVIFDLVRSYRAFDMADNLEKIEIPALILGGTHDRLTLPKASYYLASHLPQADLHVFEGCGHMSMLERHDEFNRLLGQFLNDTLGVETKPKKKAGSKR